MLLGVFTGFLQSGGIERISQHTVAVLEGIARNQGQPYRFLSLNDPPGWHSFFVEGHEYVFRGFGRKKWRFIVSVLRMGYKADLAYFGHLYFAPLGLCLRLLNPRLRYWVVVFGVEVWYHPLSLLHRLALRAAYGLTTLSHFTAEQIIKNQGLEPDKVAVIPPALDPAFMNTEIKKPELPFSNKKKIILTVGRLISSEPGKGVDTVIRSLPKVLRIIPDIFYVVVGDGTHRLYLEKLTDEIGVRDRVCFVGEKRGDDLKAHYSKADIFAMPSCQEGFGVVFLEAMALGKPVIGGSYGGIPEVIKDGINGFLVKYGDVDTLTDRLILLLRDEQLRRRMGEAGRQMVKENYTFEHFRQRLVKLLTQ